MTSLSIFVTKYSLHVLVYPMFVEVGGLQWPDHVFGDFTNLTNTAIEGKKNFILKIPN